MLNSSLLYSRWNLDTSMYSLDSRPIYSYLSYLIPSFFSQYKARALFPTFPPPLVPIPSNRRTSPLPSQGQPRGPLPLLPPRYLRSGMMEHNMERYSMRWGMREGDNRPGLVDLYGSSDIKLRFWLFVEAVSPPIPSWGKGGGSSS